MKIYPGLMTYMYYAGANRHSSTRMNLNISISCYSSCKLLSTDQPSYLANSMSEYVPGRSLRSTGTCTLSVPRTKTVIGARAFRSAAPSVWNRLPADIRNSSSLSTFRSRLRTLFFGLPLNDLRLFRALYSFICVV